LSDFLDQLKFTAHAGNGGRGCVSFRREKYVPRGGPDGGNGGRGGHVVLTATAQLTTLSHIRANSLIRAGRGEHGSGSNCAGATGKDVVIRVPLGTIVRDAGTGEVLMDLDTEGQEIIVATGGKGGLGNAAFATSRNRAPRKAQPGEQGEIRTVELELKLLADVGIIGLPNAGKSTLTAAISSAHPKIADYPFTTLVPVLGVVTLDDRSFVVADIPGLIEGAHEGSGLGHKFLRHVERTKVLLHLVDIGGPEAGDPVAALRAVDEELKLFHPSLAVKGQIIAASKADLNPPEKRIEKLRREAVRLGRPFHLISAATGAGIKGMLGELLSMIDRQMKEAELHTVEQEAKFD
jgi:GTP-binding protein